ncbi:MAG TPA: glycosyltransferase family 2 protein [Patescibacteria group bacterium]|nr:glycosyltransferase family 2 protein [Patescibacteria group bacterium]
MADLTATIITYNEEKTIQACLESLTWAKEIVVVDSGSSDRTLEICRGYTEKIVYHPWVGFIEQKNVAVSLATYDWILNIDADERVSEELRHAIERELAAPRHDGYWIARRNYFLGRWIRHGGWYPDRVLRLFDRRTGRFGGLNPHACFVISEGSVGSIDGDLVHLTYRDFSQFLRKQDRYTGISVEGMVRNGRRRGSVSSAELMFRPLVKFVQVYLLKRGFLDGIQGLIAALGAVCFNFIKYAKLWEARLRSEPDQGTDGRQERRQSPTMQSVAGKAPGSISDYVRRIERDSTLQALELQQAGKRTGPLDLLLRPPSTFLETYLLQGRILEGRRGLALAGLRAGHTFVTYVKLWERCRMNRDV